MNEESEMISRQQKFIMSKIIEISNRLNSLRPTANYIQFQSPIRQSTYHIMKIKEWLEVKKFANWGDKIDQSWYTAEQARETANRFNSIEKRIQQLSEGIRGLDKNSNETFKGESNGKK